MSPPTLTLILAATRSMGIGHHGALPWPRLKAEIAHFARLTKRPPPSPVPTAPLLNAVVMGRKTWDSLPASARPLKGRINVVVSRTPAAVALPRADPFDRASKGLVGGEQPPLAVGSIGEGLTMLENLYGRRMYGTVEEAREAGEKGERGLGRVFVIGGAEIYTAALEMRECRRIVLTRIHTEFECDTFFPVRIGEEGGTAGWVKRSQEELSEWAGEDVPEGRVSQGEVEWEYEMWERRDGGSEIVQD